MDQNSVVGTRFKVNVNMQPVDGYNLGNVDWEVKVFVDSNNKSLILKKDQCKRIDDDNYYIPIDSSILGPGRYYVTLTVNLPDGDFSDGVRIEKVTAYTGVTINQR